MSSPPFTPNEALPEDTGVVSIYPGQARTFREVIESWLLYEHGASGHHKLPQNSTAVRDADTTWEIGSLVYNTTLGRVQMTTSIDPDVWRSIGPEFTSGDRLLFDMTVPPVGWTKETDAAFNDVALGLGTSSVGFNGGTGLMTALWASRIPTGTITGHAITEAQMPAHKHFVVAGATGDTSPGLTASRQLASSVGSLGDNSYILTGSDTAATIGLSSEKGGGATHDHPFVGVAMDFNIKRRIVVIGIKD